MESVYTPKSEFWTDPAWVRQLLANTGFTDIKVEVMEYQAKFDDAKVYVENFKSQVTGMLGLSKWSEKEREEIGPLIAPQLERVLIERHGSNPFEIRMVPIIASGTKPE